MAGLRGCAALSPAVLRIHIYDHCPFCSRVILALGRLGTPYEKLRAEYEADASCRRAGKGHTWGKGKTAPDPAGARTLPGDGGLKVPMGKGKPTDQDGSSLLYNEFIVYDTKQIKQKYVLRVKFKFQQRY